MIVRMTQTRYIPRAGTNSMRLSTEFVIPCLPPLLAHAHEGTTTNIVHATINTVQRTTPRRANATQYNKKGGGGGITTSTDTIPYRARNAIVFKYALPPSLKTSSINTSGGAQAQKLVNSASTDGTLQTTRTLSRARVYRRLFFVFLPQKCL